MPPLESTIDTTTMARQPQVGTFQSIWLFMCAIAYRYLCEIIFFQFKIRDRKFWAAQKPDRIQSYLERPTLRHHIFIPASHHEGQKHPVFILIGGVAFILGSPTLDHAQARFLADRHGYLVVALSYRRAPEHRFPTAIHDVAAVVSAVLNDESLPIDCSKVVVGGVSSGASIALAVAQLEELKGRISALVAFQPLTDRSGAIRGEYPKVMPWGGPDDMEKTRTLAEWAFPAPGQDLQEKLLSPYYATRVDIPQPLCLITSSADMLCQEGYLMASKLADRKPNNELNGAWEQNGVKYWCAKDMPHSWTHFWVQLKGEWRKKQLQAQDEAWNEVTVWLDKILYK
ncbi:Alpha/Beta hydrolase protein [Xylariaceae sp. FL0016]|nr:Alpha/Beta hydrolase protein [Xylariaceae sp. FL0016]